MTGSGSLEEDQEEAVMFPRNWILPGQQRKHFRDKKIDISHPASQKQQEYKQ
jgi:hypothetical protein